MTSHFVADCYQLAGLKQQNHILKWQQDLLPLKAPKTESVRVSLWLEAFAHGHYIICCTGKFSYLSASGYPPYLHVTLFLKWFFLIKILNPGVRANQYYSILLSLHLKDLIFQRSHKQALWVEFHMSFFWEVGV